MPAQKEMFTGLPGDKVAHPLRITGYLRTYTECFKKSPDIFDNLCSTAGRIFTVDFYQVRTDPAYMHGWDTVRIRPG